MRAGGHPLDRPDRVGALFNPSEPELSGPRFGPSFGMQESRLDRLMNSMRNGLFGALYIMSKDASTGFGSVLALEFINLMQLLDFVFSPSAAYPWRSSVTGWLSSLLSLFQFSYYMKQFRAAFFPLVFIVSITNVLVLALVVFVGRSFLEHRFQFLWTLHLLRWYAHVLTSVLYIPFVSILLDAFACRRVDPVAAAAAAAAGVVLPDMHDIDGTVECWRTYHLLCVAFAVVGLLITVGLAAVVTLMFVDRNPRSDAPDSAPHGRIAFIATIADGIYSLLFSLTAGDYQWMLAVATVLRAGLTFLLQFWFLPFYQQRMNRVQCAFQGIFFWASICLIVCMVEKNSSTNSSGLVFLITAPFVGFLCARGADARLRALQATDVTRFTSPWLLEVKLRALYPYIIDAKDTAATTAANAAIAAAAAGRSKEQSKHDKVFVW